MAARAFSRIPTCWVPMAISTAAFLVKDYNAFLRAYESGQISRLMVVADQLETIATAEPQPRLRRRC